MIVSNDMQTYPDIWERFATAHSIAGDERFSSDAPNSIISAWCKENGVGVVDLLPIFRKAGEKDPYLFFPYNGHWTPKGHKIVAGELLKGLGIR